jgi:molybdopterin-containing oxidoreductase family iron-sulfur binding subunit
MGSTKKYWKGIEELKETPAFLEQRDQEFPAQSAIESFLLDEKLAEASTGRRDFLKFLGFSVAAATLASCEAPVTKAVPYVNKPENVTPGVATWYASTYYDGLSYASILVKTREGRPIFIKGNKDFGFTKGVTNPQIISSVLGLYDSERLNGARKKGSKANVAVNTADQAIIQGLKNAKSIAILSPSIISPSLLKGIQLFTETYAKEGNRSVELVQYDAISYEAIRKAHLQNFGEARIPSYDFSKARTIVSVSADFCSTWLLSNEYAQQYGTTRNPDGEFMSTHFQFESNLSITGSNADYRGQIKPSETTLVLQYVLNSIKGTGGAGLKGDLLKTANAAVKSLRKSGKNSLVVCGTNRLEDQLLVNAINHQLSAYGTTIDLSNDVRLFGAENSKAEVLFANILKGKGPDVLIDLGTNPVYTHAQGKELKAALGKLPLFVSTAKYSDETSSLASYIVPDHHPLESWLDFQPKSGEYSVAQPAIRPLGDTCSVLESFYVWAGLTKRIGKDSTFAYDTIRGAYTGNFDLLVHNSCVGTTIPAFTNTFTPVNISSSIKTPGDWEVCFYQKTAIRDGAMASNPWLQELPDPISKVTWDNYITMNPYQMEELGYATTYDQEHGLNLAKITVNGVSVTLPVYPQPGQALNTVGVALGYGRGAGGEAIGKGAYQTKEYGGYDLADDGTKKTIGANVYPMLRSSAGMLQYSGAAKIEKQEGTYLIAATQIHHTVMGRESIVKETSLNIYKTKAKEAYNPPHMLERLNEHGHHEKAPVSEFDLWNAHPVEKIGHRWGMTIDLSSCIGCGSCLVACQVENNVPVVGKDEVRRGREMHWIRLDRYYVSNAEEAIGKKKEEDFSYSEAEKATVNPTVVHMPLMCHHCNHAPCETVCPVLATTHSNEGLNQMTYNRCIGTRYCANNCPYKVRRFNWFNYPSYKKFTEINPAQDDLGRMVLNPDVTVRTRGVMEKCSFCVQRIQSVKLDAKKEARVIEDGELQTACAEACPTQAITVGDWNDYNSSVYKSTQSKRAYQALEEVGVKPNIWYKVKVRNEA